MSSVREIKRRIKSINSTKQITKAMEMVAAAKMKKAQIAALKTRYYAHKASEILSNLSNSEEAIISPLLNKRPVKKILTVLITPDKGLCGGLLSNIFKKTLKFIDQSKKENKELDFIVVGKKGINFIKKLNKIIAQYQGLGDKIKIIDATAIAKIPIDFYIEKKYDQINLIYTNFISTLKQEPIIHQLLPFEKEKLKELITQISEDKNYQEKKITKIIDYLYEPDIKQVLEILLPRLIQMQIYQAIVESSASEHSARMVAMKNASENAKDMISDLNFTYNQARQASITRELSEITAGAAAL